MGTNGFLPFATGTGANVLSDVAYSASDSIAQGVQRGTAQSVIANKAWRQGTVISSMIGQFIVDMAGVDANDGQSIATLEANFKAALAAYVASLNTGSTAQSAQAKGNVVFQAAGTGTVRLSPKNGNGLVIGGAIVAIPAAGITAGTSGVYVNGTANQALSAATAYLVSVATISGTPTLRFWNAGSYTHLPDTTAGNIGVEVIGSSGAPVTTDSLVGQIYLNASGQFQDTDGARYLLSWFNRVRKRSQTLFTANRSTTSGSYVELNSEIRNGFICWANENVLVQINGSCSNSVANSNTYMKTALAFDGATAELNDSIQGIGQVANNPNAISFFVEKAGLNEGAPHYATLLGMTQGNTATWYANSTLPNQSGSGGSSQCSINLAING